MSELRMVAVHATTLEANPTISAAWVQGQRRTMPGPVFAAEYEASFAASSGGFLDTSQIARISSEPGPVDDCVVGLDPGQRDGFGLVVVGAALDPPARLRVVHVDALDATSFTAAVDAAAAVALRFGARVVTDQHGAAMLAERLRERGVNVLVAPWAASSGPKATGKFEAYADMRTKLYDGRLEVLDDPALLAELGALQVKAAGGAWRVTSPRRAGSHGDRASALALAVAHCREPQSRLGWLSQAERDAHNVAQARHDIEMARRRRWRLGLFGGEPDPGGSAISAGLLKEPM